MHVRMYGFCDNMMTNDQNNRMWPKVGRYDFVAEPFHCDFLGRLFVGHLGNAMLNAADFHSDERGYGMHYLNTQNKTWVLSRLSLEMRDMPKAYDRFSIETWVDKTMKSFTSRNFMVGDEEGKQVFAYGRSIWALIDTDTRRPVDLMTICDGRIMNYVEEQKECPIANPGRVKLDHRAVHVRSIDTYYHDVDVNGHVNSVKYIEHVLDLFDIDWYDSNWLKRFEISYVAESYQGDRLNLYMQQLNEGEYGVKITKGTLEETEVVRCLLMFSKR